MKLEIIPGTEELIMSHSYSTGSSFMVMNGNWLAIEVKIPDDITPYNAITGVYIYCSGWNQTGGGRLMATSGISKTLTDNENLWEVIQVNHFRSGNWTQLLWNFAYEFVPGETYYFIAKLWAENAGTHFDVRLAFDGSNIPQPCDALYCPDSISYLNGEVAMAGEDTPALFCFKIWGAISIDFIADFDYFPKDPLVDEQIQFTDLSTPELVNEWIWEFGDGGWSYDQNPKHAYNVLGNYQCRLTSVSIGGSIDTHSKNITVYDEPPPPPDEFPWIWVAGGIIAGAIVVGIIYKIRK